ncbi:MAG: superoxide dismutase [Fimbriimonadales bacterium]|nr:superoxide dismutase [Fimbriimonadales bacterium]
MSAKRLSRREFLQQAAATTALAAFAPHALAIPTNRRVSTMAEIQVVEYTAKPLPEKVFETEKFGISRKTHEEHYKLYQGYVNKTNEIRRALAQLTSDDFSKGNQTYSLIRSLKVDYTFAIGGVKNHELYFENMGGGGSEPSSALRDAIAKAFGSFERWREDFKATGMGGRGWVWLAYDHDEGILFNYIGDAQNTFPVWHNTVLLAMDVYEHAYYLDFQTARARYIDAFLQAIDWNVVNARYEAALRMKR